MLKHLQLSPEAWQTGTAVVQAVVSIVLLGWYVLAAHLARQRERLERVEDFESLVRLCRDLGLEARDSTRAHLEALSTQGALVDVRERLALWRADMTVIYVCLNEVPHYEVRNPFFSTALTRLWLRVDARSIDGSTVDSVHALIALLTMRLEAIGAEIDAMAALLAARRDRRGGGYRRTGLMRRGYRYDPEGFSEEDAP